MAGYLVNDFAVGGPNWTEMLETIEKQRKGKIALTLTNDDSNDLPAVEAGSYIAVSGALYGFSSEEAIGGAASTGNINYIMLDPSLITFAWTTTPPTWSDSKQGWYDAGEAKRYIGGCYYDDPNYTYKWIYGIPYKTRLDDVADGYIYRKVVGVNADNQVQEAGIASSAISISKLKTAGGGDSTPGGTPTHLDVPGAGYSFRVLTANVTGAGHAYKAWISQSNANNALAGIIWMDPYGGGGAQFTNRYITASGEVFWIFVLRDKITKKIISTWYAPDHPCYGNGGKPKLKPHHFYD